MTERKENFILKWNDNNGQFLPIESDGDMNEGIFIELVQDEEKWRYFYIKGASLITRRTALRAANGISKTGFLNPKTKHLELQMGFQKLVFLIQKQLSVMVLSVFLKKKYLHMKICQIILESLNAPGIKESIDNIKFFFFFLL
jgi:hypothetical protein